ncbi:MAG: hypothetical protein Q9227_006901 [Pyrenula ochraceoflavens]
MANSITGVYLPDRPSDTLWDVVFSEGKIQSITSHTPSHTPSSQPCRLLLPSLCHPHIHLDKPFLLSCPGYSDLAPSSGTFPEALKNTALAKGRFTKADLLQRGEWLITESIQAGVTDMRAFVEVDATVGTLGVEVAVELKKKWADCCTVQICAFAQDPLWSGEAAESNRDLMKRVLEEWSEIDVIGSTPYVEDSRENMVNNISWTITKALYFDKHLDFHLDYNLDGDKEAMIWIVINILKFRQWGERTRKTICLGHSTRLTLFSEEEWKSLAKEIKDARLPISFISLPTSDLYMMGRPAADAYCAQNKPRGTLQIPSIIKDCKIDGAIGINNVGNAFTPWGTCDPLSVAMMGVGLYHAGTAADAQLLYECVSARARRAIGLGDQEIIPSSVIKEGKAADIILYEKGQQLMINGRPSQSRHQKTVQEVIWSPPSIDARKVFKNGQMIDCKDMTIDDT